MKSKWFGILILVALIASLLPVSVFAAAPAELKVFVRNTTGGEVDLRLTDANGDYYWLTLPAGVTEVSLTEGNYEYYAVTVCGTQVGQWNLNVSKQLDIHCKDGMLEFDLDKRCDNNYQGVLWYDSVNNIHLYSEDDWVNVPDGIYSLDVYNYFGYWPKWEKSETVCWKDFLSIGEVDSWDDVWYLTGEW